MSKGSYKTSHLNNKHWTFFCFICRAHFKLIIFSIPYLNLFIGKKCFPKFKHNFIVSKIVYNLVKVVVLLLLKKVLITVILTTIQKLNTSKQFKQSRRLVLQSMFQTKCFDRKSCKFQNLPNHTRSVIFIVNLRMENTIKGNMLFLGKDDNF